MTAYNPTKHSVFVLSLLAFAVVLGCLGRTPNIHYYRLQALETVPLAKHLPKDYKIAIGPVAVPEALDRPQIISQDQSSGVVFSEFNRWAGPLSKEVAAVLAENIRALLQNDQVVPCAQEAVLVPNHRIIISIDHFEKRAPDEVILEAVWCVKAENQPQPLSVRKTFIREPLKSDSYEQIVQAQSRALAAMSREISQALLDCIRND